MKIRRFKASTIRQALQQVRTELGADAVILSNNAVEGGVEILAASEANWPDQGVNFDSTPTAANQFGMSAAQAQAPAQSPTQTPAPVAPAAQTSAFSQQGTPLSQFPGMDDFPAPSSQEASLRQKASEMFGKDFHARTESRPMPEQDVDVRQELRSLRALMERQLAGLAWSEAGRTQPQRAELMERLLDFGLRPRFCQELADKVQASNFKDGWKEAMTLLMQGMQTGGNLMETGGRIALVGPTGVGKTTTVAKLAGQFTLRHGPGSVALITVDGHRIGTQEQLRSFGRILDIPVAYAQNHTELKDYLTRFANHRLVIVDSAGISHRDPRLAEHMAMFSEGMSTPLSTYLVMAANTQPKALEGAARQFGQFGLSGSIITKLDEAASLGGVINALVDQGLPLSFTSDGQRVPDALQAGSPHDLIRQGIALMRESAEPTPAETNSLTFGPLLSQRYA